MSNRGSLSSGMSVRDIMHRRNQSILKWEHERMQIPFEPLSPGEGAVLKQLFMNGPIWDGDILDKSARNKLIERGLAFRIQGWASLTAEGVELCATSGMDREKEKKLHPSS